MLSEDFLRLIFARVEETWQSFCSREPGCWAPSRAVLVLGFWGIEGDANPENGTWLRDDAGVRAIGRDTYESFRKQNQGATAAFPFVEFIFSVKLPNRVMIGVHCGVLSGRGHSYLVKGEGVSATLIEDPAGRSWIA